MMRHSELPRYVVVVGFLLLVASGHLLSGETLELNVMSFNIRYDTAKDGENSWPNRRELVFDLIRRHRESKAGALRHQDSSIAKT